MANEEVEPSIITLSHGEAPSIEEIQKAVGGYFEIYRLQDGRQMLLNEDGLLIGLKLNLEASKIAGFPVVGNVVILEGSARFQ